MDNNLFIYKQSQTEKIEFERYLTHLSGQVRTVKSVPFYLILILS